MTALARITLFPLLAAAPIVVASLDPKAFFGDARCIAGLIFFVVGLAFENAIVDPRSVAESRSAEQAKHDRKSFELSVLSNIACYYAPVYDYFHLPEIVPRNTATLVAGVVLMLIGEGLRISALRTLGRFFTMRVAVLEGHTVVRSGLYRFVRHPAYTGWFLLALGTGLYFGSVVGLAGTVVFVLVLAWRVKVEEAALSEQLGDAYRAYMRDVPSRFLPGLF
jgi:protein-S-isoprenylcysteine O-methyltransferase Ste14